MRVVPRTVAELERAYSIVIAPGKEHRGVPPFLAGSESNGPLLYFEPPRFIPRIIASEPGGFMSVCGFEAAGRRYAVASSDFKPGFDGARCRILLFPLDVGEHPKPCEVARLPYAHRIAIAPVGSAPCFFGSTLCGGKASREDWSQPGALYAGLIPATVQSPWKLDPVITGLRKNHGMECTAVHGGGFLLSAMEGLFLLPLPATIEGPWRLTRIAEGEHSDACSHEWEHGGTPCLFTLSPFHGNVLSAYRFRNGDWKRTVISDDISMGHIVWAGTFLGKPGLIAGARQGSKELRLYRAAPGGTFTMEILDEGVGATQLAVVDHGRETLLIVAGHARNAVLIYKVTDA